MRQPCAAPAPGRGRDAGGTLAVLTPSRPALGAPRPTRVLQRPHHSWGALKSLLAGVRLASSDARPAHVLSRTTVSVPLARPGRRGQDHHPLQAAHRRGAQHGPHHWLQRGEGKPVWQRGGRPTALSHRACRGSAGMTTHRSLHAPCVACCQPPCSAAPCGPARRCNTKTSFSRCGTWEARRSCARCGATTSTTQVSSSRRGGGGGGVRWQAAAASAAVAAAVAVLAARVSKRGSAGCLASLWSLRQLAVLPRTRLFALQTR